MPLGQNKRKTFSRTRSLLVLLLFGLLLCVVDPAQRSFVEAFSCQAGGRYILPGPYVITNDWISNPGCTVEGRGDPGIPNYNTYITFLIGIGPRASFPSTTGWHGVRNVYLNRSVFINVQLVFNTTWLHGGDMSTIDGLESPPFTLTIVGCTFRADRYAWSWLVNFDGPFLSDRSSISVRNNNFTLMTLSSYVGFFSVFDLQTRQFYSNVSVLFEENTVFWQSSIWNSNSFLMFLSMGVSSPTSSVVSEDWYDCVAKKNPIVFAGGSSLTFNNIRLDLEASLYSENYVGAAITSDILLLNSPLRAFGARKISVNHTKRCSDRYVVENDSSGVALSNTGRLKYAETDAPKLKFPAEVNFVSFINCSINYQGTSPSQAFSNFELFRAFEAVNLFGNALLTFENNLIRCKDVNTVSLLAVSDFALFDASGTIVGNNDITNTQNASGRIPFGSRLSVQSLYISGSLNLDGVATSATGFLSDVLFQADNSPNFLAATVKDDVLPLYCAPFLVIARNRVSLEIPYSEVGPYESIATLFQVRPFQKSEVKIINGALIHVKANLLLAVIGTVPDGDVLAFRGFVLFHAGTSVTLLERGLLLLDSQNELQFNSTRVSNESLGSPIFISALSLISDKAHDADALTIIDANRAVSRTRIASWPVQSLCQSKYVHGNTHGTLVKVNVSKPTTSDQEQCMLLNANVTGIYVADQVINAFATGSKAVTASIVTVSAGMVISGRGSCIGLEASVVNALARMPKGISGSALEATLDARGIDFGYVGSSKSAVFANFSVLALSGLRLRRSTNLVATSKHSYSQLIGFRFGKRLDITNFSLLAVVGNELESCFVTADSPNPSLVTENSVVFFCSFFDVRLLDHATIFVEENSISVVPNPIQTMSSKSTIGARAGNVFILEFAPENLGTLLIGPNSSILIWRNKVDVVGLTPEALHVLVATRIRFYYNPKSMFDLFKIINVGEATLKNTSDWLLFEPLVGLGSSSTSEIFADRRAISIKGNEISARADEGKTIPAVSINGVYLYPTPKYVSFEDMLRTPSTPGGHGGETDLIYAMIPPNLWNLRYLFNNHNRETFVAFISLCRNVINGQPSELVYPPVWRNANWDGGGKAEVSPGIDSLADPMDVSATGIDCNTKTISETQMETFSSTITITRKTESSKHTVTLEHTGSHFTGTDSIEPTGKTLSSSLSSEVRPTHSIPLTPTRFLTKTLSPPDGCPTHCDNITLASYNTSTGSPLFPNFCSGRELGEVRHNEWREEGAVSKATRLLYNSALDGQVVYTENWENTSAKTTSMFDVAYINLRWEGGHPPLKTSVSSSDGTKPSVGLFAFKPRIGGVELFLVKPLRSLDDQFVAVQVDVVLEFACPNRSSDTADMGSAIKIHITLLPPPKPPSLSPGTWDAVSAVSMLSLAAGIASDVFGVTVAAPAAGVDLQTLALVGISRCTKQNAYASNFWGLSRISGFGTPYRTLSPFATENTIIGIAMGNAILLSVVFLINGGVAFVRCLRLQGIIKGNSGALNKEKISRPVESRRALVVSSMEFGKFPSVTLLCALYLQNGFIISGLELSAQQRVSGAFCLLWPLVPFVSHFFIMAFLSTRAFYPCVAKFGGSNPSTAWSNFCRIFTHIVFPTGRLDAKEIGSLMFSSVLQPFRIPNRSMFICSFLAFFASAPLFLPLAGYEKCITIFTASTLLHAAFAVALTIVRPFRSRFENWASALSMLINGIIVLLASFTARKSDDGTQKPLGEPNKVLFPSLSTLVNLQIAIGIANLLIRALRVWLNSPACCKFSPFHINILTLSCSWEAVGWWPLSAFVSHPEPLFLGTPGHHTNFATHFDESEISLEPHHSNRSGNPKHAKQDYLRALLDDESVELGAIDQ